jgi:hypothetical protein
VHDGVAEEGGEARKLALEEGRGEALPVGVEAVGAGALGLGEAHGLEEKLGQGEVEKESLGERLPRALDGEASKVGEGGGEMEAPALAMGEALEDSVEETLGEGGCEALQKTLGLRLGLGVVERLKEAEAVGEVSCEGEMEALPLDDKLGNCTSPGTVQADCARWKALQGMGAAAPAVGQ